MIIGFDNIQKEMKEKLDNNQDVLLFAFNATGKTRLSCSFENDEIIETLNYNATIEDYFTWDNEEKKMFILNHTWLLDIIRDEGLDKDIVDNFDKFTDDKIYPIVNTESGEIQFLLINEKEEQEFVKISKGEETLFKWSVYYSALKRALDILNEKTETRSTAMFNKLRYVIIDDPMSSLDDYKIYTLSMQIISLIKYVHSKNINVNFLITTHHVMFYNILFNTMKNKAKRQNPKYLFYIMQKKDNDLELSKLNNKKPISYHLKSLIEIKKSLDNNTVKKNHFNMFRSVLEKYSIFLGYQNWIGLFNNFEEKDKLNKIVNMNSHEQYIEIETEYLTKEQIDVFKKGFDFFINTYKINL